jgi:surface antigen
MRRAAPLFAALALLATLLAAPGTTANGNPYEAWYVDDAGAWRSNCTFWAWQRWFEVHGEALPRWGNAGEWSANASAVGFEVTTTPAAGSIVTTWESPLGHVAFVEEVDAGDPNRFRISEFGYDAGSEYHERWLTTDGSLQFILPRQAASSVWFAGDGSASWVPLPPDGTAPRIQHEEEGR